MSSLDKMARLILDNPSITVQELARALGYAEEKSIYYWLQKAGFKGIKDFRDLVLRGDYQPAWVEYPPPGSLPAEQLKERTTLTAARSPSVKLVPLIDGINRSGEPVLAKEGVLIFWPGVHARDALAFRCPTTTYEPWFWAGDLLIVSPSAPASSGCFVLTGSRQKAGLARLILKEHTGETLPETQELSPADVILLHPVSGQLLIPDPLKILGRIIKLFRDLA